MAASIVAGWLLESSKCLVILTLCHFSLLFSAEQDIAEDSLLCRSCGHPVAKAEHIVKIPSLLAKQARNDTILGMPGVLIQLFENPQGKQFEVITSSSADVYKQEQAYAEFSWFPGFTWQIAVCPRCGFHLGWYFESADHQHSHAAAAPAAADDDDDDDDDEWTFVALILDSLLHRDFADSLLVMPRMFQR